jgi:hypothetical protein
MRCWTVTAFVATALKAQGSCVCQNDTFACALRGDAHCQRLEDLDFSVALECSKNSTSLRKSPRGRSHFDKH